MAYEKQNFVPGQTLRAAQMNHIEEGIVELSEEIKQLKVESGEEIETPVTPVRVYNPGNIYIVESSGRLFVQPNVHTQTAVYQVEAGEKYRFSAWSKLGITTTYALANAVYDMPESGFNTGAVYSEYKAEEAGYEYDYEVIPETDCYLYVQFQPDADPETIVVVVTGGTTETVKKYVDFDEVIKGKVFTSGFPNGASLPAYTSYKKAVRPGDTYYITSCVVQNDGYGIAHFFNDNQFVANAGEYDDVPGYVTDYEVTVPPGANTMYVIPGFDKSLGEYDPKIVPTMWKWEKVDASPDAKKNTSSNYVSFNGTACIVKAKYNDTEDIAFEISPGGGNGLPDIRKIFTTENAGRLDDYTGAKRTLLSSGTDIIAPHVVKAVNNANGDAPDAENFTGGNHQTNNQGSGGAVTARSEGLTVKCDNVSVDGSAWGNVVTVNWTNYIHGYNTSKADGTGREIMKEEVILTISGTRISVDVRHYALEDIVRKTYYGLQMVLNAFNSLRYIGGSNRVANACDAASDSGNKNCRNISLETEDGDVLEIGIDNVDLGDFAQDGAAHSAFATSYGKSYFAVIMSKDFAQNTGEMTTLRGYYHITSN